MGAPQILDGDLDIELFRKAYDYVIQKYDALRIRFVTIDGELFQKILPEYQCNIEYRDFRNSKNPLDDAMRFVLKENAKPFPFENANLYLERILQTGDKQFIWFTRFHHFSNDGYGRSVINKSISDTYNSLLANGIFPEIESFSYLDFLEDDLKYTESDTFKKSSEFWRGKLTPLPEPLYFTDKKQGIKDYSLHNERFTLNLHRMCYASMLKIADLAGVTPFHALLGILYTTLHKLYNKKDIVIGMPVLNRSNHKFRNTPGLFMNMIPFRFRLTPEWTFADMLNAIKTEVKECYRHQRLPMGETFKHFRHDREFKNELFDVTIVYRKMDFSQKFGNAKLQTTTLDSQIRNESLGLEIDEYDNDENVNVFFNYNPLVLSKHEVSQFARCFEAVLFELIYFPEKSIAEVKFLSTFEQHRLITTFNLNGEPKRTDKTIVAKFDDCVRDYSDKTSIINKDESLTYYELNKKANQIAHYLIEKHSISKGDIICLAADRSIDAVAAMTGIMKSGAVCLPVDSHHPRERIEFILVNSGARILITDNAEYLDLHEKAIVLNEIEGHRFDNPSIDIHKEDLAYIIYTSGSTGTPKGVMIEHGSFMNMFVNMIGNFGITGNDHVLQFASPGFDAAVFEIFQALLTGATLVIAPTDIIQNPPSFIKYMDDKKITVATIPPSYLSALDRPELPYLHTLITAGEQAYIPDVNHYKKLKKVINAYGPTEASVCASYFIAEKDEEYIDYVPIGKTVPGSSIYILNENLEPLPIGFEGELCISGPNLARGYLNNKELTIQKFVKNPFEENLKMYRTGDKARLLPDGNIEILGRIDEQVKIKGNRIELGEIESRLQNHSLIKDAVVLDVESKNSKEIAAFIVSDKAIDLLELRKFLRDFLPEYMVPQHFYFPDKIPLTHNGKINKQELRKMVSVKTISTVNSPVPTELEQKLIPIFEQVLNYTPVGVNDNFFELGGESLKIARLITQIQKVLHLEINFKTIFDNPTVRGVATELGFSNTDQYYEIEKTPSKDYYPLSHAQKRLWILSQLEGNAAVYNMPVPLLLEGNVNPKYLKNAINSIIERHEALRTIFIDIDGTPFQKVLASYNNIITEYDFSHENNASEKAKVVINKEVMTPFELSREIPIRAQIIKIEKEKYLFLLMIHHIAGDGISISILMNEISQLYNSFNSGEQKFFLKPLRIQYKDFCVHEEKLLESNKYRKEKEYWLTNLHGTIPVLNLPADRARQLVKTYHGKHLFGIVDKTLTNNILKYSKENSVSPFMVLLASLNILLFKYTGQEDIIIGTPVAGRNHPDIEDQVGIYINTIALRNTIRSSRTFIDFLQDVKTLASGAFSNSNYPFDSLIQELHLERDTSRSPLFDVLIQYQNQDVTALQLNDIKSSFYYVDFAANEFDLTFTFTENNGEIDFNIEYNTDLFDSDRIERAAAHLLNILSCALKNPDSCIKDIDILDDTERMMLLKMYSGSFLQMDEKTVLHLFEEQVNNTPDNIAVVFNDTKLSYKQLNQRANVVANEILSNISVAPDDIIAIMMARSELIVISILGILKAGAAYLYISPELPYERVKFMLQDSRSKLLLTESNADEKVNDTINSVHDGTENKIRVCDLSKIKNPSDKAPAKNIAPSSLAYLIYTSGSTGTPKGVLIEHRSLYSLICSLRQEIYSKYNKPIDELLACSFAFDVSAKQIFATLCDGNTLHILNEERRQDPREIAKYIIEKKISIADVTSSLFGIMLEDGFSEINKPELKELFLGSEALPYKFVKTFLSQENNKGINIYNFYGPTECCIESACFKFDNNAKYNFDITPIGKPNSNQFVYILDKDMNLCPVGIPGEICISGEGLARGYLNDPVKTKEKFIYVPLSDKSKIYKTGDLGRMLCDGNIDYLGRIDDQVKVRGYRIELHEIEKHLRDHEGITDAVVVLYQKNGISELAAYYISEGKLPIAEIKIYLGNLLPKYMIPGVFIQIEKIPVSSNGKLNRKLLPDPALNFSTDAEFENPTNIIETQLLEFWQNVLGLDNISIHDNFFDLGGSSLLLVRLHKRINAKYPDLLKLTDLFSKSKIIEQAEFIIRKTSGLSDTFKESIITDAKKSKYHDIAVIGIAAKIGSCNTADEFWQDLRLGVDFIGSIPEERIPDLKDWCEKNTMDTSSLAFREGCFVKDVDKFDYGFFKLSPSEASVIDPGQRLFMQTAYHALEDAGYAGNKLWGSRTGVFIGSSNTVAEYSRFIEASDIQDLNLLLLAQTPSILASRLSYLLNLKGPAMLVDTACSSSLVAVHLACQSLREGKIDSAIVGGVNLNLLPVDTGARTEIDSIDGRAHSFDDAASGTSGGEGIIAIILKPLENAIKDRDNIYAVIKGSSVNQDGNSIGITAPDANAQADVIEKSWQDAGIEPTTVSFIETHGTGTKLGDPIEIDGITKAFKKYTDQKHICAIGAVKANIGHLDSAAGLAGFLKAVLSLKNKELTPLVHFKNPNRNINFEESAAFINKDLSAWKKDDQLLRCGVSSFGLSGTNCHVILEEAPSREKITERKDHKYLFTLSARNHKVLLNYVKIIKNHLCQFPDMAENDICYSLSSGRAHYSYRLAILFDSENELITKLSEATDNDLVSIKIKNIYSSHVRISTSGKANISENEISENEIRRISDEINLILSNVPANSERAMLAANAYIKGANVLWEEFYKTETPQKISLPGYPFEKQRCWVKLKDKNNSPGRMINAKSIFSGQSLTVYGKKYDGIFLNNCMIDTPFTSIYSTLYNEKEWWLLREHKVMGFPTLVGAAYLQIAYEAGKNHLVSSGTIDSHLVIEDFFLLQPITLFDDSNLEVLTTINKIDENSVSLLVHSKSNNKDWQTYSKLKIRRNRNIQSPDKSADYLDIEEIKSRMTDLTEVGKTENNPTDENFVSASEKWHCLDKIYRNKNEFLGELFIPATDLIEAANYEFYPPLIDAALSFGLTETEYLPFSFGTVELKGAVSGGIYSFIKKKDNESKETICFDITITDPDGKILVVFTDFMVKKVHRQKTGSFFHELIWKPWALTNQEELPHIPASFKKKPVIFYTGDSDILASAESEDITCINIANINDDKAYRDLFENKNGSTPEKIIYMLPDAFIGDIPKLEKTIEKSLYKFFNFVKYLAVNVSSKTDLLITGRNASKITGNETQLSSLNMSVSALGQVLQMETPNIHCRFLDLDEHTTILEILNELNNGFTESFYYRAIRNSIRFIREIKTVIAEEKQPTNISLKEDGVYILTGGTGGIALEIAGYLAKQSLAEGQSGIKLALLNRSDFPVKNTWNEILTSRKDEKLCRKIEKIREIERDSADLLVLSADIADYEELKNTLHKIKAELGNIHGVIHCAGVAGDGYIYGKTLETFRNVIRPKIQGTIYLSQLLENEKLDFFIMASSLTGIMPLPGQSDYAAANIFLDAFASELNKTGQNALSLDFTSWKETGMAFDFDVVEDGVFKSVSTQNALSAFGEILQLKMDSVLFGESDFSLLDADELPFFFGQSFIVTKKAAIATDQSITEDKSDIILKGREESNYSKFESSIAIVWASVLGYNEINIYDNYYDLGGDSIHAIEIISHIEEKLNLKISIADLLNHLTISALAEFLESKNTPDFKSADHNAESNEIVPVGKNEHYPASSAQSSMFYTENESENIFITHIYEVWRLKGELNLELYKKAFLKLIERHESLRTSFSLVDDKLVQIVHDKVEFAIQVHEMTEEEARVYILNYVKPFNMTIAPLFRVEIIQIGPDIYLVLFDGHHIIFDAYSMEILLKELLIYYKGHEPEPLKIQYKDYSYWQSGYYKSDKVQLSKSYWLSQFDDEIPVLNLPYRYLEVNSNFDVGFYSFSLGQNLTSEIKKSSATLGMSPFMILLATSKILLGKFAGKNDITIGVATLGRDKEAIAGLIGMFVSFLPVRTYRDDSMPLAAFLKTVKDATINAFANQDYPYNELIDELQQRGKLKNAKLYDVRFSYMNFEHSEIEMGDIEIELYKADFSVTSKHDLVIYGAETKDTIEISLKYRKAIWTQSEIEGFGRNFIKDIEIITEGKENMAIETLNFIGTF
jgi:amino acid adenylation domain-containing protein